MSIEVESIGASCHHSEQLHYWVADDTAEQAAVHLTLSKKAKMLTTRIG